MNPVDLMNDIEEEINLEEYDNLHHKKSNQDATTTLTMKEICPWLTEKTSKIMNQDLFFHFEILDFYEYIRPKPEEINKREIAFRKLKSLFEAAIPDARCYKFGSAATNLFIPGADIDFTILKQDTTSEELFRQAKKVVKANKAKFKNIEFIESARVPLIKLLDIESNYEFDICFNEEGGLFAIEEILRAIKIYPEIPYLILLLKIFLRQRKMQNSYTGGIGSFLLFCMVLNFFRDQKLLIIDKQGEECLSKLTLAYWLMNFLAYYGYKFDYMNYEIDMASYPYVRKKREATSGFSLISPQNPDQNLGSSCFKFYDVFKVFKNRYNYVMNIEHKKGESILCHLINPSKVNFEKHLKR